MVPNENQLNMSKYRFDTAIECLQAARSLLVDGNYRSSANRSYYAIFHAMRAVLALEGLDFKKHSAVMGKFRELYIKTGQLGVEYSNIAGNAFDVRGKSDYEDFYLISRIETEEQVRNAENFINAIKTFIQKIISETAE